MSKGEWRFEKSGRIFYIWDGRELVCTADTETDAAQIVREHNTRHALVEALLKIVNYENATGYAEDEVDVCNSIAADALRKAE